MTDTLEKTELVELFEKRHKWDKEKFEDFLDTFGSYSRQLVELALKRYTDTHPNAKGRYHFQDVRIILYKEADKRLNEGTISKRDELARNRDWFRLHSFIIRDTNKTDSRKFAKRAQKLDEDLKLMERLERRKEGTQK